MSKIKIKTVCPNDSERLLAIYAPYVLNTAITFEYDVPTVEEFAERISSTLKRYPYVVAEYENRIVGYAYCSAFKSRAAYNHSVESTVYVDKDFKRNGIGRTLYEALEKYLKKQNITNINACIAVPEHDDEFLTRNSIEFHAHVGFKPVGEFHKCGYKFGRWYNMMWMEKTIAEHLDNPPDFIPFPELCSD